VNVDEIRPEWTVPVVHADKPSAWRVCEQALISEISQQFYVGFCIGAEGCGGNKTSTATTACPTIGRIGFGWVIADLNRINTLVALHIDSPCHKIVSSIVIQSIDSAACLSMVPCPGGVVIVVTVTFLTIENSVTVKVWVAIRIPR
jgi:hypothetical protein